MGRLTVSEAFAHTMSAMVSDYDVADVMADLLASCTELMPALAAAVLVVDDRTGGLELLTATSHQAEDLEALQTQAATGPCIDSIASGQMVAASSRSELAERWGTVGDAIVSAGYSNVRAVPMRWRGLVIGGLNVFGIAQPHLDTHGPDDPGEQAALAVAFADLATLVIVQSIDIQHEDVLARVHDAARARTVIEQAKGVLAEREGVSFSVAYDRLLIRSREDGRALTDLAADVVREAGPQA